MHWLHNISFLFLLLDHDKPLARNCLWIQLASQGTLVSNISGMLNYGNMSIRCWLVPGKKFLLSSPIWHHTTKCSVVDVDPGKLLHTMAWQLLQNFWLWKQHKRSANNGWTPAKSGDRMKACEGARKHTTKEKCIYKRGEGVLARSVFWLPEKICRTPMVYCIGKKNMKNFISPNSVLPRVFLYPVSCLE